MLPALQDRTITICSKWPDYVNSGKEGLGRDKRSGLLSTILGKMSVTNKQVVKPWCSVSRNALSQRNVQNVTLSRLLCCTAKACSSAARPRCLSFPCPTTPEPRLSSRLKSGMTVFLHAFSNDPVPKYLPLAPNSGVTSHPTLFSDC